MVGKGSQRRQAKQVTAATQKASGKMPSPGKNKPNAQNPGLSDVATRSTELSAKENTCYWTQPRPEGEWTRKGCKERGYEGPTAACHDCQTSHPPHRCQKESLSSTGSCGISMCLVCARKWRNRYAASQAVIPAQLAQFDQGWCPRCLGICACKRCLDKPSPVVGGAAPAFAESQEKAFALHTLAVLKPHIDDFLVARDAEVAEGNEGEPVDLQSLRRVPLTDRQQCDCCAACITDVHRTCSKCQDYDACVRCCRTMRKTEAGLVCGKCEAPMHLVRRFDSSDDKALAGIDLALKRCNVEAGRGHLWDFEATPENRRAVANAGPPALASNKDKKRRQSSAPQADGVEAVGDDVMEDAAHDLTWWEYGKGPQQSETRIRRGSAQMIWDQGLLSQQGDASSDGMSSDEEVSSADETAHLSPAGAEENQAVHDAAEAEQGTEADTGEVQAEGTLRLAARLSGRARTRATRATVDRDQLAALDQNAKLADASPGSAEAILSPDAANASPQMPGQSSQARQATTGKGATDAEDEAKDEMHDDDMGDARPDGKSGMHDGPGSSNNSAGSNTAAQAGTSQRERTPTKQAPVTKNFFTRDFIELTAPLMQHVLQQLQGLGEQDGPVPAEDVQQSKQLLRDTKKRLSALRTTCRTAKQQNLARQDATAQAETSARKLSQQAAATGKGAAAPVPVTCQTRTSLEATEPAADSARAAPAEPPTGADAQTQGPSKPADKAVASATATPPLGTEDAPQDPAAAEEEVDEATIEAAAGTKSEAPGSLTKQKKRGRVKGKKVVAAHAAAEAEDGVEVDEARVQEGSQSTTQSTGTPQEMGPDWGRLPDKQKLVATTREGSAAAEASNYLWTPDAADCAVDSDNRVDTTRVFQQQFCQIGKPVVVRGIRPGFLWDPDTLQRATIDLKGTYGVRRNKSDRKVQKQAPRPLTVVDQRNSNDYAMRQSEFFKAFRAGGDLVKGSKERLMLKVEDYPPDAAFAEEMPRHWQDFMQCLPFPEYAHPGGSLNVANYLAEALVKPDLGPKSYIATGRPEEHEEGDSVTKLHVDLSDAINVLVHMEGTSTSVRCGHTPADPEADPTYGGAGAVWDIFQRQDVPLLQQYLMAHCTEFTHAGKPVKHRSIKHAVHSQAFFLSTKHLQQLKKEYGVQPWHFEQHPGEGVFIPAGCPHQVRNLASCVKVAVDFVLPESLDQAFKFAEEFCNMGKDEAWETTPQEERVYIQPADRQHTDKLQAELSMCLAAKHAVEVLSGTAPGRIHKQPEKKKQGQKKQGAKKGNRRPKTTTVATTEEDEEVVAVAEQGSEEEEPAAQKQGRRPGNRKQQITAATAAAAQEEEAQAEQASEAEEEAAPADQGRRQGTRKRQVSAATAAAAEEEAQAELARQEEEEPDMEQAGVEEEVEVRQHADRTEDAAPKKKRGRPFGKKGSKAVGDTDPTQPGDEEEQVAATQEAGQDKAPQKKKRGRPPQKNKAETSADAAANVESRQLANAKSGRKADKRARERLEEAAEASPARPVRQKRSHPA